MNCAQCQKDMSNSTGGFLIPSNEGPQGLMFYVNICSKECLALYLLGDPKQEMRVQ